MPARSISVACACRRSCISFDRTRRRVDLPMLVDLFMYGEVRRSVIVYD
jgi:hypothetical protein